jgi:hypothetical protein
MTLKEHLQYLLIQRQTSTVAKKILEYFLDIGDQVEYQRGIRYNLYYTNVDSIHKRLQGLLPR